MATLGDNSEASGWAVVVKGPSGKSSSVELIPKKGKAGTRNEKRRQRKLEAQAVEKAEAARVQSILAGEVVVPDEAVCPGLTRALQESLATLSADAQAAAETPEQSRQRRLKAAKKRLKQIEALAAQPSHELDADQKLKVVRAWPRTLILLELQVCQPR